MKQVSILKMTKYVHLLVLLHKSDYPDEKDDKEICE